ncbi:MAG: 4-(cytidine 5'-diphospho)-2-C-methyl-D-erythritol kinase [Devosiaceae bacterium]|nr:4-(cytidine 5'-diphospho)-2-C-methyl-D-erythritol kinase [Devosiaceae bacterium MH13]
MATSFPTTSSKAAGTPFAGATRLAPAKINLALHVTGQRADGYHALSSLVAFASVGDRLTVEPAGGTDDQLTVSGRFAGTVPGLEANTLGGALELLRRWGAPRASQPLHIHLEKNLPVAAGIGGGSADAAALIAALTDRTTLSSAQLQDCLALGADIPMCVAGEAALICGTGTVERTVTLPDAWVVLVNSGHPVSTPDVFKRLTNKDNPPLPAWEPPAGFEDLIGWLNATRNDLRPPAIEAEPAIEQVLKALKGAPFVQMSGSGATCFALHPTEDAALAHASQLRAAHPSWWVEAGRLENSG